MERKIKNEFLKWKKDENRKNMLLYGIRQIGKTYSAIDFGKQYYKNIAYFDVSNNVELIELFQKEKVVERIILNLSILSNETLFPNDTLIIFDNCDYVDFIKKTPI